MSADLLSRVDVDRAVATIETLAARFPGRLSGSTTQHEAARWFLQAFREAGLEARLESFRSLNSRVVPARVEILQPALEALSAQTLGYARGTPAEGLELELVDGGAGTVESLARADGRAALVDGDQPPATPEKARAALAGGVAALVYVSPRGRHRELAFRAIKSVWGVPAPEELRAMPRLPGVAVAHEDGERLRQLLRSGRRVRVRIRAEQPEPAWESLENVVATLEPAGASPAAEYVLVHAHLDSWDPGITDNLTGAVLALELARAFASLRRRRRGLLVCLWDGHEIAEAAGSSWFVERHWDFVRDRVVAQVNIDSPGLADARRVLARQTPELLRFQQRLHAELGLAEVAYAGLDRAFDQSFFGAGVPGCLVFADAHPEPSAELPVLWYTHTRADTLERFGRAHFERFAAVYASYLQELTVQARLPFDFRPYLDRLEQAMARWTAADRELRLEPLADDLATLRTVLDALDGLDDAGFNARARRLARLLVAELHTAVGPYRQDRYGASEFAAGFPALAHLEAATAPVPPAGPEAPREAWLAAALRERNRLADTLRRARELLA